MYPCPWTAPVILTPSISGLLPFHYWTKRQCIHTGHILWPPIDITTITRRTWSITRAYRVMIISVTHYKITVKVDKATFWQDAQCLDTKTMDRTHSVRVMADRFIFVATEMRYRNYEIGLFHKFHLMTCSFGWIKFWSNQMLSKPDWVESFLRAPLAATLWITRHRYGGRVS